ncbi:topoisomerase DNA-binding C4 zinc finger domain-containing protein [Shigella flexneri]
MTAQVVECEKCGSEMHLKMGRFGKYMGCTNDECKNTRKILRNGEVAHQRRSGAITGTAVREVRCIFRTA